MKFNIIKEFVEYIDTLNIDTSELDLDISKSDGIFITEDKFDKWRDIMGGDKVDKFLAAFGIGPNYIPKERKKHNCPKCNKLSAYHKEIHEDTDQNDMILYCPECEYSSDNDNNIAEKCINFKFSFSSLDTLTEAAITDDNVNILYTTEYHALPDCCTSGYVLINGNKVYANVCEHDSTVSIQLPVVINEKLCYNTNFEVRKIENGNKFTFSDDFINNL